MFKHLWSRILSVVAGVVLLTVLIITLLAQRSLENAVFIAEDQHAIDLLRLTLLNIDNEHQSLIFHREATLAMRKSAMKNIVTLAITQINSSYLKYKQGVITEEQAKQQAKDDIRRMRYDDGAGYLWINNLETPLPKIIMHPILPDLEGLLLDDPKYFTALGMQKHLLLAMADICRKKGEGYLDYLWSKPEKNGVSIDQPKISYVQLFKEWGWVIGTGVYVDDIEAEANQRLTAIMQELEKNFAQIRIAKTGYLFIFNGKKKMLIHPNLPGKELSSLINPDSGKLIIDELIAASTHPLKPFDYIWDKPGHEKDYRFKKRIYMNYYQPLDWYIGASTYFEEIAYPAKVLRQKIFITSISVLSIALILSIILARNLVIPLKKLIIAGENIEKRGLDDACIPVSGTVETQQLGVVLNRMIGSIKRAIHDKEQAIKALLAGNKELANTNVQLAEEVDERMFAQVALQKARDLLEHRVEERTAELAATNLKLEEEAGVRKKYQTDLQIAMDQLKFMNTELERLANIDPLTGISNRRDCLQKTNAEISRTIRTGTPLSLLMLDIDYFKKVNDCHGHQIGDEVLKAFTQTVIGLLRPMDVIARIGGEEFTVLLPGADLNTAKAVAERIRVAVQKMVVDGGVKIEVRITVSIGVVQFGMECNNIDSLFAKADEHLYIAKNSGRNQVFTGNG
ncbi:cache domain-containing protein [Psychromonas sp. MB-3u-54]|uniref:cache domain-containing protein n=1 Tax=Psychromonas sp. MB-3u-54 TaxID=2058319 RepID=UPI0018E3F54E|nr:cache domain-containing protein [Psychromonas sp. MB-3u-54]